MMVTSVKVLVRNEPKLKAYAVVTFDRCFVIRDIKVIQGGDRLFISMPSRKCPNGCHRDVAHPLNADTRNMMEREILEAYRTALANGQAVSGSTEIDGEDKGSLGPEDSLGNK